MRFPTIIIKKAIKLVRYGCRVLGRGFVHYADEECKKAFVSYMNQRTCEIGAKTAFFADPSGIGKASKASALDMLRILVHAAGIRQITEIWNKREHEMHVFGLHERTVSLMSAVKYDRYETAVYPILGAKTGTVPDVTYNLAWCALMPDGKQTACVLMGASNDDARWRDAMLVLKSLRNGNAELLSEVSATSVAACSLPANPIMYDNVELELLLEKNSDLLGVPASLTKIMTLICAIDFVNDLNEKVRIIGADIVKGSGNNLKKGDVVTLRDLFFDMLLPSSNTAATALSRYVGKRILKSRRV